MLKNKNVIITGANRGIGNAIMNTFALNHASLWCLDLKFDDAFHSQAQRLCEECGIRIKPMAVDLSDRNAIKETISAITSEGLPIDILVNNAGINYRGTFLTTPISEMEKLFQINYYAPVQLMQSVSKKMIQRRQGIIINIGSVSGLEHNTGNSAYAVTKASLMWLTQTVSRELAPYGIRVNGIAPGLTDTMINAGNEAVLNDTVLPRMNIKRSGKPEEIAQTALFLASDMSSFISGQIIRVDGGRF